MNINLKIVVFVLILLATVTAVFIGAAVGSDEYLIPSLVAAGIAVILLIGYPPLAAAGAVMTYSSGVTLPGLPGQMKLSDAFSLIMIAICILQGAMKTGKGIRFSRLDWILVAFAGWIFLTGLIRGFGFLAFGDDMIGGFYYLRLLLSASLVITLPRIGIPAGSWKMAILVAGLLAPATLLADLLIVHGWAFDAVRIFVQTSGQIADMLQEGQPDDTAVSRLWSAGPAANGMMIALLCMVPARRFFQFTGVHWLLIFAAIITLSLLSGFRLMTATLFLIAALTLYFQKGLTTPRLIVLFVAGGLGLCVVYLFARELPNSIQRAVSWLPGIDVNVYARSDAEQTVEWRLRLWQEALRYFPDYWLIGKGFSYNARDMMAAFQNIYQDDLKWALVVGSYHNGWLSMVLCTGIIGTALCLTILIAPVLRHWKKQQAPWNNNQLKRFHGVFLAAILANALVFLVVYGDVHASFPFILFQWAVLEALLQADARSPSLSNKEDESSEPVESTYQEA